MTDVLEKIGKYDTVRGLYEDKDTITVSDVIANEKIEYFPECSPEYMATYEIFIPHVIRKTTIDMSRTPIKKVEYLYY